jgi:hypothetical protein
VVSARPGVAPAAFVLEPATEAPVQADTMIKIAATTPRTGNDRIVRTDLMAAF